MTIAQLRIMMSQQQRRNPNCDMGTDVVVDTPDGKSYMVVSATYEEDLAGALVLKVKEHNA